MKRLGFNKKRILSFLTLLLLFVAIHPSVAVALADPNLFREFVFQYYGFKEGAKSHIRNNSTFIIVEADVGGGGWAPWNKTVSINGEEDQGAVHELSHVWWHTYRVNNPQEAIGLAKAVVQLAYLDPQTNPQFRQAIDFARGYIFGEGDWAGMYCNLGRCADPLNLQSSDFDFTEPPDDARINDWEIYAGFSSWTMGRFRDGPHALPQFMWRYFEPQFTGKINTTPYYEGGPETSYYIAHPELAPISITNVSPNPAKPGNLLEITGSGFGVRQEGSVVFNGEGASGAVIASSRYWTNNGIAVEVPENVWSGTVTVTTRSGSSSYPITITRQNEGGSALLIFSATCGVQREPVVARIQVRYGLLHPDGTRNNQTLALNTLGAQEGQGRAAALASLEQPTPYKLKFIDVFPDRYNNTLSEPRSDSIYITDTSVNQSHSFSFHYPQCAETQPTPSTSATQQYPEYDTSSSGSSPATPRFSLEQSCNPTQLVAHWNVTAKTCEANIIAGSTFYPISTLCEAAWNGTAIQDRDPDKDPVPIVEGDTYQLVVKRDNQIDPDSVRVPVRVTVQCAKAGAKEGGPAVTDASCQLSTAEADNYPQCGGTCEGVTYDQSRTVLVKVKRDSKGNICGYQCEDIGTRPGQCGNSPEQPSASGPQPPPCQDEVRRLAKERRAETERGADFIETLANGVCGLGEQSFKAFTEGCHFTVEYGYANRTDCTPSTSYGTIPEKAGGTVETEAPPQKTVTNVTINGQPVVIDGSSGINIHLGDTTAQAQVFYIPVVVHYSDGTSRSFTLKFDYKPAGAGPKSPAGPSPGTCRDDPVNAPAGYNWKADCYSVCTKNEDCGLREDNSNQSNLCHVFENGARCLRLKSQAQVQAGPGDCRHNPEPPPVGYRWTADCGGKTCKGNSDCDKGVNNQEGWCYGFQSGARCLKLELEGGSNPPPPQTPPGTCPVCPDHQSCDSGSGGKCLWNSGPAAGKGCCGRRDDAGSGDEFCGAGRQCSRSINSDGCFSGRTCVDSNPPAQQQETNPVSEDCGHQGGNYCAHNSADRSDAEGRQCRNIKATWDCTAGCFQCN